MHKCCSRVLFSEKLIALFIIHENTPNGTWCICSFLSLAYFNFLWIKICWKNFCPLIFSGHTFWAAPRYLIMVLSFLLFFRDLPLSMSVQLKHLLWSTSELVICKHGIWDWFPYLRLKTLSWANDRKPEVARLQFFICDVLSLQWLCSNPEPKQLKQLGLSRFFGKQVNEG